MKQIHTLIEYPIFYFYRIYFYFLSPKYRKKRAAKQKPKVLFGSSPVINNKFWSRSLDKYGYYTKSITFDIPHSNTKEDFDIYFNDIYPLRANAGRYSELIQKLRVFTFVVKNFDILITSYRYQFLSQTRFWKKEAFLLKYFGLKIVVIPYGNDFWMYSKVIDHSLKHNLLVNSYKEVFNEESINERVNYWKNTADFIIMSEMLDGAPRWDAIPLNAVVIDTESWIPGAVRPGYDGKNGPVKILHTPNHRGIKGTEYIIQAVKELKAEGLNIELILIEKKPNTEVKRLLKDEADILVEQIIMTSYGLSGIEGMSSGIPVISNFERDDITTVFRRYSHLNECPVVSSSPENIKDNLRVLITNPQLREELGRASRKYAEKYHSFSLGKYLFENIIDKIWYKKDVNTLNMFHPLNPDSFNNQSPLIKHPLIENKLPKKYFERSKELK